MALAACGLLSACGGGNGDGGRAAGGNVGTGVAKACDVGSFAQLGLDGAAVRSATAVPAGSYVPARGAQALAGLPAFCRIEANATPGPDSSIDFQVWVPQGSAWNGKLVATGNGGYSPQLSYGDMAYAMRQGYAVIGGDTGHMTENMAWGQGHPEKIVDWGTRSIHAITVPAKRLITELQGAPARRSYYYGCSTGGHQGYAEIQRYPQDFDGVIAGAPGGNRTRLNVEFMHRFLSNRAPGTNAPVILSAAKAAGITAAAVRACDALDGVADGVMEDPRVCTGAAFDVASLACGAAGADPASCLTPADIAVARKLYAGPSSPRTGAQIYPGLLVGTEAGWPGYWGAAEPVRADYWRLWVRNDPQWNWWSFDYDRDLQLADATVSPLVDQVDPDIAAFKARGGKAIVYQGWADPVVNAADTIAYYEKVRDRQGSQAATDDFFRLFLVPGMGHCSGGSGTANFGNGGAPSPVVSPERDLLMALDRWVDQGAAPDRIVATRVVANAAVRTRPLCPYPRKAAYAGRGGTDDAASFACR
jgi:feruloyl esterase